MKKKQENQTGIDKIIIAFVIIFLCIIGAVARERNIQRGQDIASMTAQIENLQQLVYFYNNYRYDVNDMIKYCEGEGCYDEDTGKDNGQVYIIREINTTVKNNIMSVEFLCQNLVGGRDMGNFIRLTPMQMTEDVELIKKESGE